MLLKETSSSRTNLLATTAAVTVALVPLWLLYSRLLRKKRLQVESNELPQYPPGPRGYPFLGNALDLPDPRTDLVENHLLQWTLKYGLIFSYSMPVIGRCILVADPEFAKLVMVTKNYPKSPLYKFLTPILGKQSIGIIGGQEWASKRRAFNPGFAPSFLKDMVTNMAEKLETFLEYIEEDVKANLATHMLTRAQTFTADVIVSVAFGEEWGGKEIHPARAIENDIAYLYQKLVSSPWRLFLDVFTKWQISKKEMELDAEMRKVVDRRLAAGTSPDSKDICSIAIDQMKQKDGSLSEADKCAVVDQLKTFYFAGHDVRKLRDLQIKEIF